MRRGRMRRWDPIHSPMRQRFRFERLLERRQGQVGSGHLRCWDHLRCRRGGCWLGRRPDRCVSGIGCRSCVGMGHHVWIGRYVRASRNARGGYRWSCSETNLPVNRALVVLLVHDQSSQHADNDHCDHQNDQRE